MSAKLYVTVSIFLLLVLVSLPWFPAESQVAADQAPTREAASQGAASLPIPDHFGAKFTVEGTPNTNEEIRLVLNVNPALDLDNVTINVILPDGVSLVSGPLRWQGQISKARPLVLTETVKVVDPGLYNGFYRILAGLRSTTGGRQGEGVASVDLINDGEGARVAYNSPDTPWSRNAVLPANKPPAGVPLPPPPPLRRKAAPPAGKSGVARPPSPTPQAFFGSKAPAISKSTIAPLSISSPGAGDVWGIIQYIDLLTGSTSPVRRVTTSLYRQDNVSWVHLVDTTTNDSGQYVGQYVFSGFDPPLAAGDYYLVAITAEIWPVVAGVWPDREIRGALYYTPQVTANDVTRLASPAYHYASD